MKNRTRLILTLFALAAIVGVGIAADLTYTTLPLTSDAESILGHKTAVAPSSNAYANIVTATTTTAKSGSGILEKIVVNTVGSSSTATVYDNTAGSGTKIATINTDTKLTFKYGCRFGTGLTIVTVGTPDITVVYR